MWQIEWSKKAQKQLSKLDSYVVKSITEYLKRTVESWSWSAPEDEAKPLTKIRPLRGDKVGLWKLRINNYRLICKIEDHRLMVVILSVGHRKDIYED